MSIVLAGLLAFAVGGGPAPQCAGIGCGAELIEAGWTAVAACRDHNWSYLLQKDGEVRICTGVSGRGGPIEFPCSSFQGDLARYRAIADSTPEQRRRGECVLGAAVSGFLEK